MYPNMKTGKFSITSANSTSADFLKIDLGFVPAYINLDVMNASTPSSSSNIIGLEANMFNKTSMSLSSTSVPVVQNLLLKKLGNSGSTTFTVNQYVQSSTSNAVTDLQEANISSSSNDLVTTYKKGIKIRQPLAGGDFLNKTIHYTAIPANQVMYEELGTMENWD